MFLAVRSSFQLRMTPQSNKNTYFWHSYWGLLSTFSIGLLIFFTFSLLQTLFLITYGLYIDESSSSANFEDIITMLAYNGDAISFAEIPAALTGAFLVLFFTKLRRPDSVASFLELTTPPIKVVVKWLVIMLIVIGLMEVGYIVFERNTPDFMTQLYSSTKNLPLLWIAVIVAAPIFEELLFRGYILEGIKQTAVGVNGAIVITSASWAVIHLQYESFEVITIFLIGIILGIAKVKSHSLYIPIAMHMLMNLLASIMMELS